MRRKEAVKMGFFKWIRSLSVIKQICVGMATVLAVGGSATTVAVVANHSPQNKQVVVSSQSTEESSVFVEEPKSEEEKIEEAIHYSSMKISASSIEKDLDIFFLDENNKKIKGQPFSVKLVAVNDAAKLNSYVETINKLNKEIKEAEDIVSGSTAPNAASKPAASKPSASSSAVSSAAPSSASSTGLLVEDARREAQKKLVDLGKKKVEAIGAYKDALKNIKGTVYTDDNQDGRITQKKLTAGDFSLCYVPTGDYDASEFTQKTTVKDKIEYKPVVNIEEKKVTAQEAGDAQPVHEVVEESKSTDTVEYVESNKPDAERVKESKANPINAIDGTTLTPGEGFTYDAGAVVWNQDGKNRAEIPITPNSNSTITGVESLTEGLDVEYKNGKIIATANNVAGDAAGPIDAKIRVTYSTTKVNDPSSSTPEENGSSGQTNPDKKDETPASSETKKDETPASSETKKDEAPASSEEKKDEAPASSGTNKDQTPTTTVVEGSKDIVIVVHGYNEQLKDSQGRLLFSDKNGTPATVGDYDPNATYYYVDESVQVKYQGWQTINGIQYYFDKNGKKVTGPQVILGVRYNFGTDGALLSSGIGIDVSKWQGDINWSEAKAAVSFAIIRAGFRGTSGGLAEDEYAAANIRGCNANGIKCGLYFYSRATCEAEAVEEASLAVAIAKKGSISLPIYFDMESPENRSAENKDALVMAFCRTVQAAGYSAGLYASKNWINNYLNPSTYGGISIWVAQYADTCNYGGHYDMWQYTSKGSVPGISTNVDMNESHF